MNGITRGQVPGGRHGAQLSAIAAVALLAACGAPEVVADQAAELRIRKVVLFQNGVGYFERRGKVEGERLALRVRPDQINDVLKSLTILHLSGGRTASVTMPVEQSADRLAAQLPGPVRDARGLYGLLQVLRGVEVTVDARGDEHHGKVVGVETIPAKDKGTVAQVTLLLGDNRLVSIPLARVDKVRIHDRALAAGLARSLAISRAEGQWKPVGITVHFDRGGSHDLLIGYIHEVPIWRPAYRAWVEKDRAVRLQGWAVVDNVSGEDWQDVRLSLVVGSPLSFRYDLHRPHHVQRPDLSSRLPQTAEAPPEPDVGYGPAAEESAGAGDDEAEEDERKSAKMAEDAAPRVMRKSMSAGRGGGGAARSAPAPPPPRKAMEPDVDIESRRAALQRSAQAMAEGRKMGQLYRYDALSPVTVGDGQAALVHIVDKDVQGGDIYLFRHGGQGELPYRSLMVRNPKGAALESGPITLYVDGTFAGEGFLGRIDEDATAFVPFAAATGFALTPRTEVKTTDVHLARASGGKLTIESKRRLVHTITIRSERDEPSLCYVKLALQGGMELQEPPKDIVRASGEIYVPVRVPAKGEGSTVVTQVSSQTRVVTQVDGTVIEAFRLLVSDGKVDDAVKGPVREILALQEQIGTLARRREDLQRQRYELEREAERIRNNLDSLPLDKVADKLRKTLVDQLEDNSRKAAVVTKTVVEIDVEMAAIREKIAQLVKTLELK